MRAVPLAVLLALPSCSATLERFELSRPAMGTELRIVGYATERARGETAARAAFERVAQLDALLSDWRDDSEVARLARRSAESAPSGPLPVSEDLWRLLVAAEELSERSDGAFDVTIGPLVQLWRRAGRQGALPDESALAAARAAAGFRRMQLDRPARTVEFRERGMRLDLGGIAKGYAADAALAVMRAHGVERALVALGGDVVAGAPPPGRSGWIVALAGPDGEAPRAALLVKEGAVSTSGDTYRFVEIAGRRFSHVVDPRTGLGLERRLLVSVLARDGATADALATAVSVLGPGPGLTLVAATQGAAARVVEFGSGAPRTCASSGWPPMMEPPSRDE